MLMQYLLDLLQESVHSFLGLSMHRSSHDLQQTYDRVFWIAAFDCLFPSLRLLGVGSIPFFASLNHGSEIFPRHSPCVLPMCKIDGEVDVLHMGRKSLYCLLPGCHHSDHLADLMGINVGDIQQSPLCFNNYLSKGLKIAVLQVQEAHGHLAEGITEMA